LNGSVDGIGTVADFSTHVFGAAALCSFGATFCTKLLALPMAEGLALTAAGTVGGILPDIDLKVSWPSRLLFTLLGSAAGLAWLFANVERLTVLELWFAAVGIYLIVRYPMQWLFHSMTVHRGALHSLAATAMAGLLMAAASHHLLGADALASWMLAAFLAGGYLLHLALDEIYSVDFTGMKVKRSFGTAIKPIDTDRLPASCVVLFTAVVAWFFTPDPGAFLAAWSDIGERWTGTVVPRWLLEPRAGP